MVTPAANSDRSLRRAGRCTDRLWVFSYRILTSALWGACDVCLIWQMKKLRLGEDLWLGWDHRVHKWQRWDWRAARSDSEASAPTPVPTLECLCDHRTSCLFDSLWESLLQNYKVFFNYLYCYCSYKKKQQFLLFCSVGMPLSCFYKIH